MKVKHVGGVVLLWLLGWGVVGADVVLISGNSAASTEGLGAYTGSLSYSATNSGAAQLVVQLTNHSNPGNGGFLTAFALNNPGNHISGISFGSSSAAWGLLGAPGFNNGVAAPPFGSFDFGASITNQFLGGGSPLSGLGVGQGGTFTFNLTGTDLDQLSAQDFLTAFGADPSPDHSGEFFLARFRGFTNGGSDKVPGKIDRDSGGDGGGGGGGGGGGNDPPPVPEPTTLLIWGLGAGCLLPCYRRMRKTSTV